MKKMALVIMILLAGAFFVPQAAYALPIVDGIAYYSVPNYWTATVNYEVYAPGETANGLAGDSYYHYFYYVTNTTVGHNTELSLLSVGNPYALPIIDAGYRDRVGGTVAPWAVTKSGSSIKFYFSDIGDNTYIWPDNSTEWLFFTTAYAPGIVDGGIQDGGTNDYQDVPGPMTPEPASAALLGMGLIGFAGRAIRRKFMA